MIVQDKEDECLMTALRSLASDGWRTHSPRSSDNNTPKSGEAATSA